MLFLFSFTVCICLRSILGISWRDHITNDEVMARSEQMALLYRHSIATRRRFVGHILRLPTTRPASLALEWIPEDDKRRVGRRKRTWQDTLKEDFGVDWSDDWRERYCQRSCQMETTRCPMFCSEREELSLSLSLCICRTQLNYIGITVKTTLPVQ